MSDNPKSPRSRDAQSPARLINPTVRDYMDTLNLQRFYGGYVLMDLPDQVFNLGIGEVGGVPLREDLYDVYTRFEQSEMLAPLATRYSGTLGQRETTA